MRIIAALFACLCFVSTANADSVGVFTVTRGEVQLLRGQNYLAASPGVEVQSDDIMETGKAASAQIDMEDGSVLKLGPETRVALSDYSLDANKNVVSATLDVLSGWLRFAVAKLKPQGKYSFNTPVLTVGVRGTEGTIEANDEQGGLHLEEGAVDVTPAGPEIAGLQPVRVISGEFIQRLRGQQLAKLPQPPAAFKKRLPPGVQEKLSRRVQTLKERGVQPKVIRRVTREDAKRLIERHPNMQQKLRERFKPLDVQIPLAPDKGLAPGGNAQSLSNVKERGPAPGGFGGKVLRERQLKTGNPSDPNDVAEGLRKRLEQRRQDKLLNPGLTEGLQRPGLTPEPLSVPATKPLLRNEPTVQPSPGTDKLILQRLPAEQKPASETEAPQKTPTLQQVPMLQRQIIGR